jgi:hypothetical protein
MATKPAANVGPVLASFQEKQLLAAATILFWETLHGIDYFTPSDPVGTEAIAFGLVSHLALQYPGKPDSIVENLAKLNLGLTVTVDGNSTQVTSTRQYRELMLNIQSGLPGKTVMICTGGDGKGPRRCWPLSSVLPQENTQNPLGDPNN